MQGWHNLSLVLADLLQLLLQSGTADGVFSDHIVQNHALPRTVGCLICDMSWELCDYYTFLNKLCVLPALCTQAPHPAPNAMLAG